MTLVTAIISIFAIFGAVWLLNKIMPFKICPVCAGVAGTWLWMLTGKFFGYTVDTVVLTLLMGGSVVGIAYQIEKHIPTTRSPVFFKLLFIPIGLIAADSLIAFRWTHFLVALLAMLVVSLEFLNHPKPHSQTESKKVEELKKRMQNCC